MSYQLENLKRTVRYYRDELKTRKGKPEALRGLREEVNVAITKLFREDQPYDIRAVGSHPATSGSQVAWEDLPDDGLTALVIGVQVGGVDKRHVALSLRPRLPDRSWAQLLWHVAADDIYGLTEWQDPSRPAESGVVAVQEAADAYRLLVDKVLSVAETDAGMVGTHVMVTLAKELFFNALTPTYLDADGKTEPTTIAQAIELAVLGGDLLGDKQGFGYFMNEVEILFSERPVTPSFQVVTGSTYGELLRQVVLRYMLELACQDEEMADEQEHRFDLAKVANRAAGLSDGLPDDVTDMRLRLLRSQNVGDQFLEALPTLTGSSAANPRWSGEEE